MKQTIEEFCEKVLNHLRENREWEIIADWVTICDGQEWNSPVTAKDITESDNLIEIEHEAGAFYQYMTISVDVLYDMYSRDGWAAVTEAMDDKLQGAQRAKRRTRGEDYTKWLDEEGRELYRQLREIRASFAATKQLPPYFICVNRALYEMCRDQPSCREELMKVYGIGEKSADEYGEAFLHKIEEFTGGIRKTLILQ